MWGRVRGGVRPTFGAFFSCIFRPLCDTNSFTSRFHDFSIMNNRSIQALLSISETRAQKA